MDGARLDASPRAPWTRGCSPRAFRRPSTRHRILRVPGPWPRPSSSTVTDTVISSNRPRVHPYDVVESPQLVARPQRSRCHPTSAFRGRLACNASPRAHLSVLGVALFLCVHASEVPCRGVGTYGPRLRLRVRDDQKQTRMVSRIRDASAWRWLSLGASSLPHNSSSKTR